MRKQEAALEKERAKHEKLVANAEAAGTPRSSSAMNDLKVSEPNGRLYLGPIDVVV